MLSPAELTYVNASGSCQQCHIHMNNVSTPNNVSDPIPTNDNLSSPRSLVGGQFSIESMTPVEHDARSLFSHAFDNMETVSNPECSDYPIVRATFDDVFSVPASGYFDPDPLIVPDIAAWRPSMGVDEEHERREQQQQQQQQCVHMEPSIDPQEGGVRQSATQILHKLWDISDSCLADINDMRNKATGNNRNTGAHNHNNNYTNSDIINIQSPSSSSEDGSSHSHAGNSSGSKKQRKGRLDPTSHITREMLQAAFQMQIKDAADFMGVGRTCIKQFARRLGIPRWPYRQLKSLDRIQEYVKQLDSEHQLPELLCGGSANKLLSHQRSIITSNPGAPLSQAFRRHRQTLYKKMFQLRKRATEQHMLSASSISSPL